jgi:cyclic pyranopterin phosphate synthase
LGRALRDLRMSVTDRCNFRCGYCMPKEAFGMDHAFLQSSSLLSFEEAARIARLFAARGVEKIRLTGGEPLLRKNLERLIEMLAALRTPEGRMLDLALTTNGSLHHWRFVHWPRCRDSGEAGSLRSWLPRRDEQRSIDGATGYRSK